MIFTKWNQVLLFVFFFIGGSQFKITVNDTIIINRIDAETGDRIRIEKVGQSGSTQGLKDQKLCICVVRMYCIITRDVAGERV